MNISWYSHYFSPEIGAPSARIAELSKAWIRAGHRVSVSTCFPNHPTGRLYPGYRPGVRMHETREGIDVHRSWTYITPNSGFAKKLIGHISFLPSSLLINTGRGGPADVVVGSSPTFFAAMAAALEGKRRRVPFIMEIRDLWPAIFVQLGVLRQPLLIRMLELLELLLYRHATRVITVTESFRQNLIKRGVPASKVVNVPNGADIDFWTPPKAGSEVESGAALRIRRKLGLTDQRIVLYIGAHGISHALDKVLESARRLQQTPDIHFLFVGEGAEKARLVSRARQSGLKNVTFIDAVDKDGVKDFYLMADICLAPLRNIPLFDAFIPSKIFEIMAMGRPIVGSVRGEAADIIKRSGGGIVVEPENSKEIAGAIRHLVHHREEGRAMGERGRRFVCEHYSRKKLAARYLRTIREAVQEYR